MIRAIEIHEQQLLLDFLKETAPDQVFFIESDYYDHGENIAFGWFDRKKLIGCIRYCIQTLGTEQKTPLIKQNSKPLKEAKINAFAVQTNFRNRNIGTLLQQRVIDDAKEQGCYQLASYSTFDKAANYAIKIRLGFCVQPEIQPDGTMGAYFLMKL